ncbi:MAG: N-acetyl-gamma-glutamyl-phosphate reductase [Candidatus Dormibacteria bacterium]
MLSPSRPRAAVFGATGYLGSQCAEMLHGHPDIDLVALHGRSYAGSSFASVVPGSGIDLVVSDGLDVSGVDLVFAALPHAVAAHHARKWLNAGAVVVDMSADFRIHNSAEYERWYGVSHPAMDLCAEAVYALVELERERILGTDLLAVPGCYPTATLLATLPALRAGVVEPDIVVDAKSGVSGAGRSPSLNVHFSEANESVRAYGADGHRHKAEMLQEMRAAADEEVRLTFVPHLVPMTRGILVTAYLHPRAGRSVADVGELQRDLASSNHFVRYDNSPPPSKSVSHSNVAAINVSDQDGVAVVTCAIDNLIKGGAGQAVQACNIRCGFDETAGLLESAPWP